jgi:hypothetical protein
MSLTLRSLGLRVCYFLGYYKEKVEALEARIAILEEQNKLLSSTECLYVQYCDHNGCSAWCIDGDHSEYVKQDPSRIMHMCVDCDLRMCQKHRIDDGWSIADDGDYLCKTCVELRRNN